jgi:hypothetical protein
MLSALPPLGDRIYSTHYHYMPKLITDRHYDAHHSRWRMWLALRWH